MSASKTKETTVRPKPAAAVKQAAGASGTPAAADDATRARMSMPENNGATVTKPTVAKTQKSGGDFKATLTVKDMVVWGLITMVPISPMAVYGGVFADSSRRPGPSSPM